MRPLLMVALCVACSGTAAPADAGRDAERAPVDAPADAPADAGPRSCTTRCPSGLVCASEGVAELAPEPGDDPVCTAPIDVIGRSAPTWRWRAGGRPLGARTCISQGFAPGLSPERRARQLELLRAAGIHTLRLDFPWAQVEPERGRFELEAWDAMVDDALAEHFEVIAILAYGSPWAGPDLWGPPDDVADFAHYAAILAARYGERLSGYEIWNEPNAGYRFWRPSLHGDATTYAAMLAESAAAIHATCERCAVLSGGLFFHAQVINGALEFTHDVLTARPDALAGVARLGFHPYPLYPPVDDPDLDSETVRSIGGMVDDMQRILALHDVPELPVVFTELGWPVAGSVDEARQASLLSRAFVLSASLGVDPICWFNLADGPRHGTFPPEDDFGLYRYPSDEPPAAVDPKPARDALAWIAAVGAEAVPAGPHEGWHDETHGVFALDFDTPRGTLTVAWARSPTTVSRDETRTVTDHFGRPVTWTGQLGRDPLFLVP